MPNQPYGGFDPVDGPNPFYPTDAHNQVAADSAQAWPHSDYGQQQQPEVWWTQGEDGHPMQVYFESSQATSTTTYTTQEHQYSMFAPAAPQAQMSTSTPSHVMPVYHYNQHGSSAGIDENLQYPLAYPAGPAQPAPGLLLAPQPVIAPSFSSPAATVDFSGSNPEWVARWTNQSQEGSSGLETSPITTSQQDGVSPQAYVLAHRQLQPHPPYHEAPRTNVQAGNEIERSARSRPAAFFIPQVPSHGSASAPPWTANPYESAHLMGAGSVPLPMAGPPPQVHEHQQDHHQQAQQQQQLDGPQPQSEAQPHQPIRFPYVPDTEVSALPYPHSQTNHEYTVGYDQSGNYYAPNFNQPLSIVTGHPADHQHQHDQPSSWHPDSHQHHQYQYDQYSNECRSSPPSATASEPTRPIPSPSTLGLDHGSSVEIKFKSRSPTPNLDRLRSRSRSQTPLPSGWNADSYTRGYDYGYGHGHGQDYSLPISLLPSSSTVSTLRKQPILACYFCRGRKIACGGAAPDNEEGDRTCRQCKRRGKECIYPKFSRRGYRRRNTVPDFGVGVDLRLGRPAFEVTGCVDSKEGILA